MKNNKINVVIAYNKEYDIHEAVIIDNECNNILTCLSIREGHSKLHIDILNNEYELVCKTHNISVRDRERIYKLIETMTCIYETHDDEHIELVFIGW